MSKFRRNQRVIVKDNPTWGGGKSFDCVDPLGDANPGTMLIVVDPDTDMWGDIQAKPVSGKFDCTNWFYISEDSVVSAEDDVRVGDKIRVFNRVREIVFEGVVKQIDDDGYVWIGKGYDIAYNQSEPDLYDVTVLERAERWPDHAGFIRITGGLNTGHRGLARQAIFSDQIVIDTDDGGSLYKDTVAGQGFDFEYVEG